MIPDILLSSLEIGLIFSLVSLGVFITFKILHFPDMTVDGSIVTGAAVSAISIVSGLPIFITLFLSFIAGAIAGVFTALIHIKFKINKILAGIITLTILYTVNLRIMSAPNISLLNSENILFFFKYESGIYSKVFYLMLIVLLTKFSIDWFLQTEIGLQLRATGDNEETARALSINTNKAQIILLALSNGLFGFAGGLLAQDLGFADVNMGIGTIILGVVGVMLGTIFIKSHKVSLVTSSIILGSVLYQFVVNVALRLGLEASDLKLIMGLIVLTTLAFTTGEKNIYEK